MPVASSRGHPAFEDLTETAGLPLSNEAADMMVTRYALARDLAAGRRVLELGCGTGLGFGMLGSVARTLIGGDLSLALLRSGRRHYGGRYPFVRLSADQLPFRAGTFDLIVFFEASYYVPDADLAFREIARLLAPGGSVLFANANPQRRDFIRSPHSVHYHSADELRAALEQLGLTVRTSAAFPLDPENRGGARRLVARGLGFARRTLEGLGLVPTTLRGRARLKRLVYGRQREAPPELTTHFGEVRVPQPVPPGPVLGFKVLYVHGHRG